MFKEVMIERADGSDTLTPLMANAATSRRYKQVFGEDLLTLFANAETDDENGKAYHIDFLAELAYIMNMQALAADGKAKLDKLNPNGLLDWLEQFEGMAIENAATDILNVYLANTATASTAKKNKEEQSES